MIWNQFPTCIHCPPKNFIYYCNKSTLMCDELIKLNMNKKVIDLKWINPYYVL